MSTLTKLTLPVKEGGVITNKTYDLPTGAASIIVEVTSSSTFAGYTCYCYDMNNTIIAQKTLNSNGRARFELTNSGTYKFSVITGEYETITVESNNVYQLTMNTNTYVNATIISAINDVVYFTDAEGLKSVVTDSTGEGHIDIAIPIGVSSREILFHSSAAKDPDDPTEYFSVRRDVYATGNPAIVYVAPAEGDKLLFWYGYKGAKLQAGATGWTLSSGYANIGGITFTSDRRLVMPTNAGDGVAREALVTSSDPINHAYAHMFGYNIHLRANMGGRVRKQMTRSLRAKGIGTALALTGAVGASNYYHHVHEGDGQFHDAYTAVYTVHASDGTYERTALYGFWLV